MTPRIVATGASSRSWRIGSDNSRNISPSSPSSPWSPTSYPTPTPTPLSRLKSQISLRPRVQTLVLLPQDRKPILKLCSHIRRSSALLPETLKLHTQALLPQTKTTSSSSPHPCVGMNGCECECLCARVCLYVYVHVCVFVQDTGQLWVASSWPEA